MCSFVSIDFRCWSSPSKCEIFAALSCVDCTPQSHQDRTLMKKIGKIAMDFERLSDFGLPEVVRLELGFTGGTADQFAHTHAHTSSHSRNLFLTLQKYLLIGLKVAILRARNTSSRAHCTQVQPGLVYPLSSFYHNWKMHYRDMAHFHCCRCQIYLRVRAEQFGAPRFC